MKYLVVGGTSGIGLAATRRLVAAGHEGIVWSRRSEPDSIPEPERQHIEYRRVDVTSDLPDDLEAPSNLDGLLYAPGSISLAPFRGLKLSVFEDDYNVNVLGAVRVLQKVLPALVADEGASVVLMGSVAASTGMSFHASIAAAKSAVTGLARSLAAELAAKNVRVNVVSPSLTDTPLASRLLDNDRKRASSAERHPLKRVGTPEDQAAAITFLLSPETSWITGQVLGVDGGLSSLSGM